MYSYWLQHSLPSSLRYCQHVYYVLSPTSCLVTDQGCIICAILPSGMGARGLSSEHVENMETLLFTAFLVTVLKILTYALVGTWSLVSPWWEHVKRKMHPCYRCSSLLSNDNKCLTAIRVPFFPYNFICDVYLPGPDLPISRNRNFQGPELPGPNMPEANLPQKFNRAHLA